MCRVEIFIDYTPDLLWYVVRNSTFICIPTEYKASRSKVVVFLLAYFLCLNRVYYIDFSTNRPGEGIISLKFILLPFIFCSCRLVLRRHYCLAIRICDYLKIPKGEGASRILGHWACYEVSMISGYRLAVTYMLAGVFLESAYCW